jgi:uncharacterized protein (TIGR02118 family)
MITAITLLKRKPGLSTHDFQAYWRTKHAAVIGTLPGIERYTQSHPIKQQVGESPPSWDGVAELWARDSQAFREIGASQAYRVVLQDEENFLDRSATALVLTEALLLRDGGGSSADGVKYIRFLKRRADLSPEEFQARWRDAYGPLVEALPGLTRYVQYRARLGGYQAGREPLYDGFDVSWFAGVDRLRAALASPAAAAAHSTAAAFLADGEPVGLVTRELSLIA